MANNEIKAKVIVEEHGLSEVVTKGKAANKQITDLEKNTKAYNNAMKKSSSGVPYRENVEYGEARSAAGTGAAGRDFAKQARGLGGLVHVYATFAANIFAVTAAFTALDRAYSTIRLEQSADIMSNKIGFSVKNLSKDLVEATGHAISFQEAMQFSNIGISAGLTAKQITNLTVIAKGAANALGRDMGDAVRRIVQGTAKQEQEILDELGIFVRAKTAYAEYAKKIGAEGPDALTAQQRVQAYAEQVAIAGEKWKDFAKIEDPFSKFTAKLYESGTELLNVINKVIAPILELLSTSKTTIEGILVAISASLLSRALPGMREGFTKFFTVDSGFMAREADKAKTLMLKANEEQINLLKAQKIQNLHRSVQTDDIFTEGIDKSQIKLDKFINTRKNLTLSYDIEAEKLTANNKLRESSAKVSGYGISTNLLQSALGSGSRLEDRSSMYKAIQSATEQSVNTGNRIRDEQALNKLKLTGLISEKSTLESINILASAKKSIYSELVKQDNIRNTFKSMEEKAEKALLAFTTEEKALKIQIDAIEKSILISKQKQAALGKANYVEQERFQSKLKDLEAERVGLEESRLKHVTSNQSKRAQEKISQANVFSGISLDLGDATGFKNTLNVLKSIPGQLTGVFTGATGAIGKATAAMKIFGFVGSLAVRGILSAMGPLMMIWAAFDLLIKPLLTKFELFGFGEQAEKIAEAAARVEESTTAARAKMLELNAVMSKGISGEDLLKAYEQRAAATLATRDSIIKLLEELKGKKLKEDAALAPKEDRFLGGKEGVRFKYSKTEKSTSLLAIQREIEASTIEDKTLPAYTELLNLYKTLEIAEVSAANNSNLKNKADKEGIIILEKFVEWQDAKYKRQELEKTQINSVIEPLKVYGSTIDEIDKKYKNLSSIKEAGILSEEGMRGYTEALKSQQALLKITDAEKYNSGLQSILLGLGSAWVEVTKDIEGATSAQILYFELLRAGRNEEAAALLAIPIRLAEEQRKIGSEKDTFLQTRLGLLQEGLKLQNLRNQQEERSLGFITAETLQKVYTRELDVASAELAKESEGKKGDELKLVQDRYNLRKEELKISNEQRLQQSALNELKIREIEPAKNALEIAKAEYNYKKATIGTSALEDIKQEAATRRKEFALRQAEILKTVGIEKTRAQITLDKDKEIASITEQTAVAELQKKERQESVNLGLEMYLDRQEELIKGEDKLANYDKLGLNFAEIKKIQIEEELSSIGKLNDINLKLLKTAQLKVNVEKAISDEKKRQHEIDKKVLEEALGTKDYQATLDKIGGWSTIMFNEAHKRTSDFKDSMRGVITGAFDGLYAGIDTAIDNLTTKWMKGQKLSLKEIVLDFRNAAAEEFRKMAAEQMKLSARKTVETIILASTSRDIKERDIPKAQLDYLQSIDDTLKKLLDEKQAPAILAKETMQAESSIFGAIYADEQAKQKEAAKEKDIKKSTEALDKIDSTGSKVFENIFEGVKMQVSSIFGNSGLLRAGFDILKDQLTKIFSPSTPNIGTSAGSIGGDLISSGIKVASSAFSESNLFGSFFANGGVMSQYGALKLNTYASGGIATSPQLAIFGEGRQNEAYVPLPDGKSIPVKMDLPKMQQTSNSGPISINVTVNSTTGQSNTQVSGQGDRTNAMAEFGALISQKVKEEIINQSRPNGLLNR